MGEADLYRDRLALALEAAGLDLWENNLLTGEVTRKASQTYLSLGYNEQESAAHLEQVFQLMHPDDVGEVKASVDAHLSGRTPQYRCEFRLKAKDGRWVWFANYGKVMDAHADTPGQRFIGVTFNIDDRKRREQEMEDINRQLAEKNALLESYNLQLELLATTDSLTGLVNRRRLMELGVSECKRAERFRHALSLLMIDIDFFKAVNDAWGHQVGDHVICAVADACAQRVRQGVDTVARVGGEEFVVLLPETGHAQAHALAETLRQAVAAQPVSVNDRGELVHFTVSIGVATHSMGGPDAFELLLNQADKALYKAKQAGRNQVQGPPNTV
ncbi:MAG TPA: sensor domain-containing diguanylate cyclase [Burkholderiaceae bacterium]|nr:sensor domain-containing diguanylate cyclase [Burkholderiaceae bacterium]